MSSWRPLPGDSDDPRPVGESVAAVARQLGLGSAKTITAVFGRWESIVGEQLARHVRPLSLRDGVLVVAVDEPAWATEVRYLEATIVERVQAAAGDTQVTGIQVRVERVTRRGGSRRGVAERRAPRE